MSGGTDRAAGAPSARAALVLAGGTLPLPRLLPAVLADAAPVVAADGGLAHARTLGLTPDLLVGDLDSVSPSALAAFPGIATETHPRDKDELDLELALRVALRAGATEVRVLGAFGSRLDQGLAALLIAARHATSGVRVALSGGHHEAHVTAAGGTARVELPAGTTVSLLALEAGTEVTSRGVAYPLERQPLPYGTGLGVSNRAEAAGATSARVELHVHAGSAALLVEHDPGATDPKAAIWGTQAQRVAEALAAADPDLAELITRVAYDEVFARPALDLRTRELLAVALLASLGATDQLPTHLRGALLVGASEEELRETLIHASMFVGFPRALAAMRELQRFLERRG